LGCGGQGRDHSPDDHACWEVNGWFTDAIQEEVGWYLHENVTIVRNMPIFALPDEENGD